jgi:hypothetical protein
MNYDWVEEEYWELVEWLKIHAPLTLQAFKTRKLNND